MAKKQSAAALSAAAANAGVVLPSMEIQRLRLRLIGDSPLVTHRWSEKQIKAIEDKQSKKAKGPREVRDPQAEFLGSMYPFPGGGWGFPAIAFKAAAVDACSMVDGLTKVQARGAFHIPGELVKLHGAEPRMRQDMVRVGMGSSDIRYRAVFDPWFADLDIRLNAGVLSAEQLLHLFDVAGFAVGVGEGRPQKDRDWGMFHVARDGEVPA